MKRCKHEYTAYKYDCDDLPDPLELEYMECLDCGVWLPLGPSNDDSPEVAIEMRASELADITSSTANSTESIGWLWHEDPAWGELDEPDWHAGYLARCIAEHATTECE